MSQAKGITLVEILVMLALAGVLAVFTIPKFVASQTETMRGSLDKTEQAIQALAIALQNYQDTAGETLDLDQVSYETLFYNFGNYFSYRTIVDPTDRYFLLSSGARLTANAMLFYSENLPEYKPRPLTTEWNDPNTLGSFFCGEYSTNECVYIDINGEALPNKTGKNGDLVPLRIDPDTGRIQTLYQWHVEEHASLGISAICRFVSYYDVGRGATNANQCP